MRLPLWIISATLLLLTPLAFGETRITLLHTSDMHSHFTNRGSVAWLGGMARLKTKVDFIRNQNQNSLLLDSGDWSEGTMFFTLNSGESTQRLIEAVGYDVIVLGNHDWFVGPKQLYKAFLDAQMKVPVVSANLDLSKLPDSLPLKKYLPPYWIKTIGGKKVGVIGLSTFQVIFDVFFEPVNLLDPNKTAKTYVELLRKKEKCDVIIALSHLGYKADESLAKEVKGIDMILGGHDHALFRTPKVVNGVPIMHVGKWGEFLGEYQLLIADDGKVSLEKTQVHVIDSTIQENSVIKLMVEGFTKDIEKKFNEKVFGDNQVYSQTRMGIHMGRGNDILGHWLADSEREATGADLALESPNYVRVNLLPGWSSSYDIFNLFPHIFDQDLNRGWNIATFDIRGATLRLLMNLFLKFGHSLKMSNTYVSFEPKDTFPIVDFKVAGMDVANLNTYHVAGSEGVIQAIQFLKKYYLGIGISNIKVSDKEVWRTFRTKLKGLSPITKEKLKLDLRLRSTGIDIHIPQEFVEPVFRNGKYYIQFSVMNTGLSASKIPQISIKEGINPWEVISELVKRDEMLKPGEKLDYELPLAITDKPKKPYAILIKAEVLAGELTDDNNSAIGIIYP